MQVESGISKYAGRVPPLDLTNVSVCPRDSDQRWNKMQSSPKKSHNFDRTSDGLPIGKCFKHSLLRISPWNSVISFSFVHCFTIFFFLLFLDPRDWTRADVWRWLVNLSLSEGLEPSPELAQKFPMNGKALCLMSLDMYLARVPVGGKMLYRDFRVRLARAMSL